MAVMTKAAPAAAEDKELLISGSEAVAEAFSMETIVALRVWKQPTPAGVATSRSLTASSQSASQKPPGPGSRE